MRAALSPCFQLLLATSLSSALAGCTSAAALVPCSVEQLVAGDASGSTDVFDVGNFVRGSANYTDVAMVSAQMDLLNAIKRGQAFRLVYDAFDASGGGATNLRAGWSGTLRGGSLHLVTYAGRGNVDSPEEGDFVSSRSCETVVASPSCTPRVGVPCLQCNGTDPGMIVCRN